MLRSLPLLLLVALSLNAATLPRSSALCHPSGAHATSAGRDDNGDNDEDEEKAKKLFEKAEALAAKSKYKEARRAYAKLLREYPHSSLAAAAERRSRPSGFAGRADLGLGGRAGVRPAPDPTLTRR